MYSGTSHTRHKAQGTATNRISSSRAKMEKSSRARSTHEHHACTDGHRCPPGLIARITLFVIMFVVLGVFLFWSLLTEDTHSLMMFVCNKTFTYEDGLTQCLGLNDNKTCAPLGVACVQSACGYKLARGIDLSVSGASNPLGSSTPTDVKAGFMIFWSLVPYGMFFCLFAAFLFAGDTTSLSFILLLGLLVIVNEGILKHSINQRRPQGSCLYFKSYGMPSGHATTSIGMLTNLLLETWIDRPYICGGVSRIVFSFRNRCLFSVLLLVLLLPVPFSRVVLNDHYISQVAIGSAEGLILAVAWFLFMYKFAQHRLGDWVELRVSRCFLLRNTYRQVGVQWTPEWARCRLSPHRRKEKSVSSDVEAGVHASSRSVRMELVN